MAVSTTEQFKLKKFVKELELYRGRHTEMVTVYIPQGYDMNKIMTHLRQEQDTASNIKSTSTRKNVIDSLERMIQHLKMYTKTPDHGLAVFSGNVSEKEGQSNVQVWSIEPPVPIKIRLYRCDKEFVLDPIRDMMEVKDVYGLVVLDRRDAAIALLKGKSIIPLKTTHSEVPGKMRAGGQSAQRFERLREDAVKAHFKKIAGHIKNEFLSLGADLKGIIIGGPGTTVTNFLNQDYITGDLKKKIMGTKDLSYTGDFGLQELLEKSEDLLAAEEVSAEKKIMQKFFDLLAKTPGKVEYGLDAVKAKLSNGIVEILLISEESDDKVIEEFEKIAEQFSTEVRIISTETREGVQLKELGKVAAILRYAVE
ncbi:peptide chain release factor aRF-1 [Nanoarchaeota archaeon]